MKSYHVAVIGGDGTGPEVTREALKVCEAAGRKFGFTLNWHHYDFGGDRYLRTGEVLPDGEKGELVITSLQREGSPLLRYRTRDITFLMRDPCPCGRTTVRIHRLLGRTDDMMIVRGVNIFPSQIENVLMRIEGTQPHYQIVIDRGATHLDEIEIRVEVEDAVFSDVTSVLERLRKRIHDELKSELGISAHIKLVEPRSIARSEGKAQRIIDRRSI